jgi:hypothetical protein
VGEEFEMIFSFLFFDCGLQIPWNSVGRRDRVLLIIFIYFSIENKPVDKLDFKVIGPLAVIFSTKRLIGLITRAFHPQENGEKEKK